MVIQEGYFYHLMDSFFREVNDKTLMSNKENGGYRPHFFSIRDKKNPDIFWMVPISSRYEKYKAFREMQVKKYGRCTKVVLGKFAGKQCAFLVQNAFPTTADYFDHVHTRFNQPATITPKLKGEIVRCLTSNFAMHKRGIHLFYADIDRLYTLMERKLQSERTRCSLRRVSRKRNLCRKPLRHKDSYMKKRILTTWRNKKFRH